MLRSKFHYKYLKGPAYKFHCGLCSNSYYGECISHLDIRFGESKIKPSNDSAVCDHLLYCNFLPSFGKYILAHENEMHLLEITKSLLLMRDKPSLNKNISSTPFWLCDKVF